VASPQFAQVFGGNTLLEGMQAYATNYGGHQFGTWAGQLGDGRAITLGEAIGADGKRLELQLKGAGPTPYARTADGRAVLRSSVREFLCSEAMHHLGVPTTRALCLIGTGEEVVRDMLYDGHPRPPSSASAISNCPPRAATSRCSRNCSTSPSGAITPNCSTGAAPTTKPCAPNGSCRSANAPR